MTREQEKEIEELWIAGVLSVRQIAANYGMTEGNIRQLAKRRGWPERGTGSTAAEIAQKKAALLPVPIPANVEEAVEELAGIGANIIQSHRKDLAILRSIVMDTAREVQYAYQNREIVEERILEYFAAKCALDPFGAAQYEKECNMALSCLTTGSRSKTLVALTQSYDKLVSMERQNWKLDAEDDGRDSYEKYLKEIHEQNAGGIADGEFTETAAKVEGIGGQLRLN